MVAGKASPDMTCKSNTFPQSPHGETQDVFILYYKQNQHNAYSRKLAVLIREYALVKEGMCCLGITERKGRLTLRDS